MWKIRIMHLKYIVVVVIAVIGTATCDLTGSHPNFDDLSAECQQQLQKLYGQYENSTYEFSGCDSYCLAQCLETLEIATGKETSRGCPDQEDIMRCMGYFASDWKEFQENCYFFKVTCDEESEAEGCASESEAEATEDSEAEATDESESSEDSEAESETSESEESESESAPTNDTESTESELSNRRRRLLSEGEGESESEAAGGAGCFPAFASMDDFEAYLQGSYFDTVWSSTSNTVGIILSVFFWISLAGMGWYLRKPHRG